jgi:RimJ/RimL family protein N-acetyltransferase
VPGQTAPVDPVEITAGRLHLRAWRPGDEAVLVELFGDPETQRWTSRPLPYLIEHATEQVQRRAPAGWADGTRFSWAVCDSTTAEVLADLVLFPGADRGIWVVGFACLPSARGRGIATQAVGAVTRWAFAELGASRLEWLAGVGNGASRRVAEKAGFRYEGTLRHGITQRGQLHDAWLAARLPRDPDGDTAKLPPLGRPTDGVVALRRLAERDVPLVQRAASDPEIARWLPVPVPYTVDDARSWALEVTPREWFDGSVATAAVVDAETDELVGAISLTLRTGIGEVGYWTAPWARGHGVAVRATRLLTAWGVRELGLPRVELLTDVDNLASQRVADGAGFVREGVARAARPATRREGRVDMVVWALVP